MALIPFFLQQADAAAGSGLGMLIPLVLIVVIMYFFMIRPQNKKQKETEKMLSALKKGDKVITIGGIHGTISSAKEDTVVVKVDDGTKIEFNRSAIATVVTDKPADADKKVEDKSTEKKSLFGKKTKKENKDSEEATEATEVAEATEATSEESGEEKNE